MRHVCLVVYVCHTLGSRSRHLKTVDAKSRKVEWFEWVKVVDSVTIL